MSQHQCAEMAEYSEQELAEAEAVFLELLERNQHLSREHPTQRFLQFNFNATYDERERRKRQATIKLVK